MTSRPLMTCHDTASVRDVELTPYGLAAAQRTGSSMQLHKSHSSVRRQTPDTSGVPLAALLNAATRGEWQKKITPEPCCGGPPPAASDAIAAIQVLFAEESSTLVSLWDGGSLESE